MNIFMLGWEFPPFISGGLGTACYGLTRAMNALGHRIVFVLPQPVSSEFTTHVDLRTPGNAVLGEAVLGEQPGMTDALDGLGNVEFRLIPSALKPYAGPGLITCRKPVGAADVEAAEMSPHTAGRQSDASARVSAGDPPGDDSGGPHSQHYGGDMFTETRRYARIAVGISASAKFDVIHAHDWMTYPAGIAVAAHTGKPLVIHVHSTDFDRSGPQGNDQIRSIERAGIHAARKVICVSRLTRNVVLDRYAGPPDRVEVVYNAIDTNGKGATPRPKIRRKEKVVLFLGRITMQKGPEYFLAAARKVLSVEKNVRFVMAGSGDRMRCTIEMAAEMGIGRNVLFTGFLRGDDVARAFKMADLFVMPSVSEPFGLTPLEALSHGVPVLISKQSGVSEVLGNALKVDFWDVDEMANKILAVLRHAPLRDTLCEHGGFEISKFTWKDSARGCVDVYDSAIMSALDKCRN